MKYIVIKAFQDVSGFKKVGESIELDDNRAAKLRKYGLIGGKYEVETAKVEIKIEKPKIEKAINTKRESTKKVR